MDTKALDIIASVPATADKVPAPLEVVQPPQE
jgi:hypothetical protein